MDTQQIKDPAAGEVAEPDVLLALLADLLEMKQEAFRDLGRALEVAKDTLQPLADNKPLSGAAQRALVIMALMSLSQASEALEELTVVAWESRQRLPQPQEER